MEKQAPYKTIKEMEVFFIKKATKKYNTLKTAAKMLGITERTLHNKMDQYKLK